ncbi:MAG: trypsin-like peptidase domain-containing protein [Pseudomonadota bacterium]
MRGRPTAPRLLVLFLTIWLVPMPAASLPEETLARVVSVLPVWPNAPQGGGARPGRAPEGSGVVLGPDGIIATALHVVDPAERIDVRLSDGRVLPARLIAEDTATDIALLKVDTALAAFETAPPPGLAGPVCAIGNAYGLGLSVSCGVVSALAVSDAGFNAVEDFVQTDAASNPGMSGGALVDADGRLVGMMSAIFASDGDGDIGVNFAVSAALLERVTAALLADGEVVYPSPGWRLSRLPRARLRETAGALVAALAPEGPADRAGILPGDVVTAIGARRIQKPRDAIAAIAILPPGSGPVTVVVDREGSEERFSVSLDPDAAAPTAQAGAAPEADPVAPESDCPHPAPVCEGRQAVFPISGFMPVASATRIGPALLVTNRHNVADEGEVVVFTPEGPLQGRVVPSAYEGDLALIAIDGLPEDGLILALEDPALTEPFFAIGADVARQEVRVFDSGTLLAHPAEEALLGRLHVTARMQPGVSGGALLDPMGRLVGIAAGGGEGRFEAIPIADVRALIAMREAADAEAVHQRLGAAFAACTAALDRVASGDATAIAGIAEPCAASQNQGQFLEAGRILARAGDVAGAIDLHRRAVAQTPNSINARLSLLVSLQLGGRFPEMMPHARWMMTAAPDDPSALRFSIQSGVWGGDEALAEEGYRLLLEADPRQAQAARRFIDNAPPAPPRR